MGFYQRYILPELIQLACSNKRFNEKRQAILPQAHGHVLEIGIGSGLNLPHYDKQRVKHIIGLEPSQGLRNKAQDRADEIDIAVDLLADGAEAMPLEDHSIDTIVTTFTLCSVQEIEQALSEMRRVLKSDGQLLFCEHGRAPEHKVQGWQDRINPWWRKVAGGCNLNRDFNRLLSESGFEIEQADYNYMQGPRPFSFIYKGIARSG